MSFRVVVRAIGFILLFSFVNPAARSGDLVLSLPLDCAMGRACFIQQYVDVEPGPASRDYRCGSATYEGHNGTDFRVLSAAATRAGINVLAAAPGVVKGVRDGVRDVFARVGGKDAVAGRECGNGLVVEHGEGWETQYCHLRNGSVAVKAGEHVGRGQVLGQIGYSGLADFAHLHLSVRKEGRVVDPFSGRGVDGVCAQADAEVGGLWDQAALGQLAYATGVILGSGFSAEAVDPDALEERHDVEPPGPTSAALVYYVRGINLAAGDRIVLSVAGPGGFAIEETSPALPRSKATYVTYAGKKRGATAWAKCTYTGSSRIERGGKVIATHSARLELR